MPAHPVPNTVNTIDYRVIAALSLLLSVWLIAIDPVLDRDAILYLRSADAYLQDGFLASQRVFGRPLLSLCFALLHQVTGIPLVYAGLLLNSLFYVLLCTGFVATVATLGGDRRVQVLAAIVILSHPVLNDQRSTILRDPAYWGLILLAFRELLLYTRQPNLRHRLRWFGYILAASLFRFEGLFFATLAPLSLLATSNLAHRWRHCLLLLLPTLLALAGSLALLLYYLQDSATGLGRFSGIENYLDRLARFPASFAEMVSATGNAMLDAKSSEDAPVVVLAGLGTVVLLNICRATSWPWALVLLWGSAGKQPMPLRRDDGVLLLAHLLICLLYLVIFALINHFMLERYASQLVIFALLPLPFLLDRLWRAGKRSRQRYLVAALLALMTLDSLHNLDHQKAFIRDANEWLQNNAPPHASLVSNNQYLAYFSRMEFDWNSAVYNEFELQRLLSSPEFWQGRNYIAMRVSRRDTAAWEAFLRDNSLTETIVFEGGRHGTVGIVQLGEPKEPGPP